MTLQPHSISNDAPEHARLFHARHLIAARTARLPFQHAKRLREIIDYLMAIDLALACLITS
jgi:hypothetical protein